MRGHGGSRERWLFCVCSYDRCNHMKNLEDPTGHYDWRCRDWMWCWYQTLPPRRPGATTPITTTEHSIIILFNTTYV